MTGGLNSSLVTQHFTLCLLPLHLCACCLCAFLLFINPRSKICNHEVLTLAIAEVSVVPLGTGSVSVSEYVAGAIAELQKSGLSFQLTPMGTIIEGSLEDVLAVIRKMHETPFNQGARRVYTTIKIDDRRDRKVQMGDKVQSVRKKLKKS